MSSSLVQRVAWANIAFVVVGAVVLTRLYSGKRYMSLHQLRTPLFVAVVVSLVVAYMDAIVLGRGANFTMYADKLRKSMGLVGGESVFRGHFIQPRSFEAFVFVYDPLEASFDSVMVTVYTNKATRGTARTTTVGTVFPDDPTKRMISIYRLASGGDSYMQPRSTTSGAFLRGLMVQFFLSPGGKSPDALREATEKFQALATKGTFMVRRGGRYVEIKSA